MWCKHWPPSFCALARTIWQLRETTCWLFPHVSVWLRVYILKNTKADYVRRGRCRGRGAGDGRRGVRLIGRRRVRKLKATNRTARCVLVYRPWPSAPRYLSTQCAAFIKHSDVPSCFILLFLSFRLIVERRCRGRGDVWTLLLPGEHFARSQWRSWPLVLDLTVNRPNSGNDTFTHEDDGVAAPAVPQRGCALLIPLGAAHLMLGKERKIKSEVIHHEKKK